MKYATILFLLLLALSLTAQSEDLIFDNGIDIEADRYPDVKGSPYLFEDEWVMADLLTKEMKRVEEVQTRYNLYTGEFEVSKDNKVVRLISNRFMRIEFEVDEKGNKVTDPDDRLIFQASFHPRFRDRFVNLIYSGKDLVFFRDYRSIIDRKEVQNIGQVVEPKRFFSKADYFIMQAGELKAINPNKNALIKILGHKKELEAYLKEHEPDLESAADLKKLFTFAETLN